MFCHQSNGVPLATTIPCCFSRAAAVHKWCVTLHNSSLLEMTHPELCIKFRHVTASILARDWQRTKVKALSTAFIMLLRRQKPLKNVSFIRLEFCEVS